MNCVCVRVEQEFIFSKSESTETTLQRHNTENSKQIFPEKELRGLRPNFHIYVSAAGKYVDRSWEYINQIALRHMHV